MLNEAALKEVRRALNRIDVDGGGTLDASIEALASYLDFSHAATYRPVGAADGRDTEFFVTRGFTTAQLDGWRGLLRGGAPILNYDPLRPATAQRNRVVDVLRTFGTTHATHVWFGLGHHHQLRVLVCDGPLLLGWIGGFRLEPFSTDDARALAKLVAPMRRMFRIDRRLRDGRIAAAGLAAALESMAAPAAVVGRSGVIDHANAAARDAFDAQPRTFTRALGDAIEAFESGLAGRAEVIRLASVQRWLVMLPDPDGTLGRRIAAASTTWRLTPRQTEVLARIAAGDANKTIADRLGCSLATVEVHVTHIYRKARVDGRAPLIIKLFTSTS